MSLPKFKATSCECFSFQDGSGINVPVQFVIQNVENILDFPSGFVPPQTIQKTIFPIDDGLIVTNVEKFVLKVSSTISNWLINVLGADPGSLAVFTPGIGQEVLLGPEKIPTVVFLKHMILSYTIAGEKNMFMFDTRFIK